MKKILARAVAAAMLTLGAASALAAPAYCLPTNDGTNNFLNPDGLSRVDVTYGVNGPTTAGSIATDCYGIANIGNAANPTEEGVFVNGLSSWGVGGAFSYLDKTGLENPGGVFGATWTITGDVGNVNGFYTLTSNPAPSPSPAFYDFVFLLKAGSGAAYAAYYFDDVAFDGSSGGSFSVRIAANLNDFRQLSHLTVFGRVGSAPPPPQGTVPEAGSLALASLALLGLGLVTTRRRRS